VVDEHRPWGHADKGAVSAEGDTAQVVVVADAAKHQLGVVRGLAGRGGVMQPALAVGYEE
jgi:hypothetical protein